MTSTAMVYLYFLFVLSLLLGGSSACSCPPDNYIHQVCKASFVGRISSVSLLVIEEQKEYFWVRVVQGENYVFKGGNIIQRAYRVINPFEEPCAGPLLESGKSYFITGLPTVSRHYIDYTTCQLVIEWSEYETNPKYEGLRNFMANFDEITSCV